MKSSRLHDGRHHVANCVAFGENAEAEGVEDGTDVILYFVTANRSRNEGDNGQFWLYDDAQALPVRFGVEVPAFAQVDVVLR